MSRQRRRMRWHEPRSAPDRPASARTRAQSALAAEEPAATHRSGTAPADLGAQLVLQPLRRDTNGTGPATGYTLSPSRHMRAARHSPQCSLLVQQAAGPRLEGGVAAAARERDARRGRDRRACRAPVDDAVRKDSRVSRRARQRADVLERLLPWQRSPQWVRRGRVVRVTCALLACLLQDRVARSTSHTTSRRAELTRCIAGIMRAWDHVEAATVRRGLAQCDPARGVARGAVGAEGGGAVVGLAVAVR